MDNGKAVQSRFLASVSHELRNPLGVILLNASLLGRQETSHAVKKAVANINKAAQRMERVIADLLDVASIEAGHFSIERAFHSPQKLFQEVVQLWSPVAAQNKLSLVTSIDYEGNVLCDEHRMFQVISNLVKNSIANTKEGGTIEIGVRKEAPEKALFYVSDTGVGMSCEQVKNVFEVKPFETRNLISGRMGLGLSIAASIIAGHGGKLWIESKPGDGTTVFFSIPTEPENGNGPKG